MKLVLAAVLLSSLSIGPYLVVGHVYLHNPRGSNNRLNEHSTVRDNAKRIFDSQNNGKGGYNVGDQAAHASNSEQTQYNMAYFQSGKHHSTASDKTGKSYYVIEWTNQHGCGDRDLNCNIILQYKCQPDVPLNYHTIRNGRTVATPSYHQHHHHSRAQKDNRTHSDLGRCHQGLHEPWEWYDKCIKRRRNEGLFTADQKLMGTTSVFTRQNAQGTRFGYECPEEREYYPYWHPTDWIDIAVLTQNESFCEHYINESFNVKPKGECLEYYHTSSQELRHDSVHNNNIDCKKNKGHWVEFSNYLEESPLHTTEAECKAASTNSNKLIWAIPYRSEHIDNLKMVDGNITSLYKCLVAAAPVDCKKAPYTRSNHLGNAHDVVPLNYTWVLPYFPSNKAQKCVLRIRYNISSGDYEPFETFSNQNDNPDNGIYSPVRNNPKVKVGFAQLPLKLAINTAQFGRTFQDRSHIFKILPRPKNVKEDDVIHNLNVRGKRGNIVQVYPAVEYDFIPKRMKMSSSELVHIQWTGSNTNPSGNAGQGSARTDRNNMVEMEDPSVNYPLSSEKHLKMFENAEIVWSSDILTKTKQDLILSMASSGYYSSMSMGHASPKKTTMDALLNNAPASYRGMLLRFSPGVYYYMCTRNNNFSNRNQKGRLTVIAPAVAPKLKTVAPKLKTVAPKLKTAAPKSKTAAPKSKTAAPKSKTAAPKSKTVAPKSKTAAPKLKTAANKSSNKTLTAASKP